LKERCGDDKQKLNMEMMKLYKETGTNPLSSCLPILVQSPFFFALFHVLSYVAKDTPVGVLDQQTVRQAHQALVLVDKVLAERGIPSLPQLAQGLGCGQRVPLGSHAFTRALAW